MKLGKRLLLCGLILLLPLLCTACLNPVQLHERAIVQAVGIDWVDDEIQMTFQIFSPAGDGSTISANAENAKIITTTGSTVSDAVQNATLIQGKQLFMGHSRILIIGKALAERGLEQPLRYFSANAFARSNTHLVLAEETAAGILSAKINQGILPADTLEAIAENAAENGIIQNIELYEFLRALEDGHESSILPVIRLKTDQKEGGSSGGERSESQSDTIPEVSGVEMASMAVFSGAKLAGILTREESRGLLWIRDEIDRTVLTASTPVYETAAVRVHHLDSALTPDILVEEGEPRLRFRLEIHADGTILEAVPREGQESSNAAIDELEDAAEEVIRRECHMAFTRTTRDLQSDVLGLGSLVWKTDVELWKQIGAEWSEALPRTVLQVEVVLDIDRVGLEEK